MITQGQARYLLAIDQMRGRERTVTRIAQVLGVSKPSVTSMINGLAERGLVKKERGLALTGQGKEAVEEIRNKQSVLTAYLIRELGLAPPEAKHDALALMFETSEKFVASLIQKIETDAAQAKLGNLAGNVYLTNFQGILADGIYAIPFKLLRKNDGRLSMGDKGLVHPAKLVVVEGYGLISLCVLPVTHRALQGCILKGRLARLSYWNGEEYREAWEEEGRYSFPVMNMHWHDDQENGTDFGVLPLKVQASVGVANMPESLADLAVYLEADPLGNKRFRVS
jgi:Mn-dependent DtxR family transcriptional regulator